MRDHLAVVEDDDAVGDADRGVLIEEKPSDQTIVAPMADFAPWTDDDAAAWIAVPGPDDDKYSRGVLGVVTGSTRYPGAAVLSVEAALHTGVGMLRYLGPERPTDLVLARRPEAVTADGRVQGWLLGSGIEVGETERGILERMDAAATSGLPCVLDAGALHLRERATGPVVLTPHAGELARLLGVDRAAVAADAARLRRARRRRVGRDRAAQGTHHPHRRPGHHPVGAVRARVARNRGRGGCARGHPRRTRRDPCRCDRRGSGRARAARGDGGTRARTRGRMGLGRRPVHDARPVREPCRR